MKAYVLIMAKPGTSEEVVEMLKKAKKTKGVIMTDSVYGRFDAIVIIEAPDVDTIGKLIYKVIQKNPNITNTETLLTLF
jgi:DNA-binding Lrp family transcriptional regulator